MEDRDLDGDKTCGAEGRSREDCDLPLGIRGSDVRRLAVIAVAIDGRLCARYGGGKHLEAAFSLGGRFFTSCSRDRWDLVDLTYAQSHHSDAMFPWVCRVVDS